MLTQFECIADALRSFPFGFLSKELDMPQFCDVTHMRTRTRTHVNTISNLDDSEFVDARWEKVHVGPVRRHDGVDFIAGHHGVRDVQAAIDR